jgi:hypothetical protein
MSRIFDNEKFLKPYRTFKGPAWRQKLADELPPDRHHQLVREAERDVRDLHHFRLLCAGGESGKEQAAAARAAASPLSALTWGSGTSSTVSAKDKALSPRDETQ